MPPAYPERWLDYKACGKVIEGTRIICFKVPLSKCFQNEKEKIWDIKTLLKTVPNLSGIIDITNTDRYYHPTGLTNKGIQHKKILTPGRMLPPEEKVTEFMDTVDKFLKKDDESLVGVHCTHGVNRTGYMVCRYLRDRLGLPAKEAIKKFQRARGYVMERDVYIYDILGTIPSPRYSYKRDILCKPFKEDKTEEDESPSYSCDDDSKFRKDKKLKKRHFSSDETSEKKTIQRKKLKRNRNDSNGSNGSTQDYDFKHDY